MKPRLMIMDTTTAKDSLVDRYVVILRKGFPHGTLAPFKRWVAILAGEMHIDQDVLLEEIRIAAKEKSKLQSNAR